MEVKQIEQIGFRVRISRRDETMLDFGLSVLVQFSRMAVGTSPTT